MNNVIIACKTLEDELNLAMHKTGCHLPVIWLDSGYHNDPGLLQKKIQEQIDNLQEVNNILFAYGCCGNGLIGLVATTANLIIPRTEDCISMVLSNPGKEFNRPKQTYFLTQGWMKGAQSIFVEYDHALERYGLKRTQRLFDVMLKNYNYLTFIDTGAYDVEKCKERAEDLAQNTGLKLNIAKGSIWFLEKLLKGPHDQDFCVVPRGETVDLNHFGFINEVPARQVL